MACIYNTEGLIYKPYSYDNNDLPTASSSTATYAMTSTAAPTAASYAMTSTETLSGTDTSDYLNIEGIYRALDLDLFRYRYGTPTILPSCDDSTDNIMRYNCSYLNITNDNYYNSTYRYSINSFSEDKKEQKKYKIRSNLIINIPKRGHDLGKISNAEWIAMQTLRDMISESDYRKYLKYGFISVTGASGKIYQIFRDNWHTKVFFEGTLVEEICVRITDKKIPPTDNVIAFKTIIETDEESFAAMGNVYRMVNKAA